MSKRYEYYLGSMSIKDNETNKVYDYVADLLNEQDQKIKDLEHRLSNCIEPKFKVGQELYVIDEYDYSVVPFEVDEILINEDGIKIKAVEWEEWFEEDEVFITREEAEAKAKLRSLEDDSL